MSKKYRIVVDESMPGIELLFADLAEIVSVDGRKMDHKLVKNADALLCRSITPVNKGLLAESSIRFVGTATIGIDHLDIGWLDSQSIEWANAAGCNASAVAQYVLSAIAYWSKLKKFDMHKLKIGIVGAGHVGSELARCLDLLEIEYLLSDPPLKKKGDKRPMLSLDEIINNCDVISLHVPLVDDGRFPTKHLIGRSEFSQLTSNQLLINASRGAVLDNQTLISYLKDSQAADVILDVFEKEPAVPQQLLDRCLLATPHIAGHTLEGKLRGSWMIYIAFCQYFELQPLVTESQMYPLPNPIMLGSESLADSLLSIYDIAAESSVLGKKDEEPVGTKFDRLRKNATQMTSGVIRRDYSGWEYKGNRRLPL